MADRPRAVRLEAQGNVLELIGELGFDTVSEVLEPGRRAIAGVAGAHAVLDLSQVTRADSAGLALVVDWLRAARARELELELRAVPAQLADIARVSDLETLIPGGDAHAS